MPIKTTGILDTELMFLQIDTTAKKRVKSLLIRRAYSIRDLARQMAPRDTALLEKAIEVKGDQLGATRDAGGRFARTEVEVYIDLSKPVEGRSGKTLADYAYFIHEHQFPYGATPLGELSKAKQDANPGIQVGGGFLERAAEHFERQIDAELLDIFRDL